MELFEIYQSIMLNEITLTNPYYKEGQFNIVNTGGHYSITFNDDEKNEIVVYFKSLAAAGEENSYAVDFTFNKVSTQDRKSTAGHYLRVLSTVFESLIDFVNQIRPLNLIFSGMDKSGNEGQKDRIYESLVKDNKRRLEELGYGIYLDKSQGSLFYITQTSNPGKIVDDSNKL